MEAPLSFIVDFYLKNATPFFSSLISLFTATENYDQSGGLEQQDFIPSQFQGPEV